MLIISVILIVVLTLLAIEKRMVRKSIRCMTTRIHVNGTRGKSSVTEYVAAGIASSGSEVLAKITGIVPSVIHNGIVQPLCRTGAARVQEQIDIIGLAFRKKVKNIVLECMSISPELQKLETSVIQPHIYVITNIRDDHREEMGKDVNAQAEAICSAMPVNCKVITTESRFLKKINDEATAKKSIVVTAGELDEGLRERLPYGVFPENVALALTVCREAGINRDMAERGIMKCISESTSPLITVRSAGKTIRFLNAFAANDVDSAVSFIGHWKKASGHQGRVSVVLNTRADRPLRTGLFSEWLAGDPDSFDKVILTGNHQVWARHKLVREGFDRERITCWGRRDMPDPTHILINTLEDGAFVAGVGNIAGDGFRIINKLR
ncbi:MAG: poly-gamma-glutamate synthase PgsB [Bacteroidales bacterium]|nr:poly-gamma-glutamate synthase PgsB [Bacteroidales bacterium]